MMDITAILHMHAELSLTAVFILMFLLDLFLPAPQIGRASCRERV